MQRPRVYSVCAYTTSVPFIMVHRRRHDMLLSSVRVSFPSKCAAVLQALLLSSTSLAIPYSLKRLHTNMPLTMMMMMMMMMTTTTLVWWAALDRIRSCCSIARELHFWHPFSVQHMLAAIILSTGFCACANLGLHEVDRTGFNMRPES